MINYLSLIYSNIFCILFIVFFIEILKDVDFMRYVIVCLIKGEALKFHEETVKNIVEKFNVKRQRLPAHFTIKAPFETDNIKEIENLTEKFCSEHKAHSAVIDGFGHFGEAVVYMDVQLSKEAVKIHDKYIDLLKTVNWLEWKRNEGKGRVFHCTLVSKLQPEKFTSIWEYVSNFKCHFPIYFDNISILRWEKDRWVTHKEFKLSSN